MSAQATARTCEKCGTDITQEQITQRQAGLVQGVLLCPACVEGKRKEAIEAHRAAAAAQGVPVATAGGNSGVLRDITQEKINLVDDEVEEDPGAPVKKQDKPRIRSFSEGSTLGGAHHDARLKRHLTGAHDPPTRCRTFHSKLTPGALAHMDDIINDWLDANPEVFIKNVNVTVGPFEAKHVEQHLIVVIFY